MNIVIGITGGIAAYKVCDLINFLRKKNPSVNIDTIMTAAAQEFITPLTIQTLSKNKVNTKMFEQVDIMRPEHISLAERADVFVVYPATANYMGKVANGIADDLLSTVSMAISNRDIPKYICPAMNNHMWLCAPTQKNKQTLEDMGFKFLGPTEGQLACNIKAVGHIENFRTVGLQILGEAQT